MTPGQVNRTDPQTFLRLLGHVLETNGTQNHLTGLLLVHFENFERLVSAFGYRTTSEVVATFAKRLRGAVRSNDSVVRIGDSKFAVIINPLRDQGILILAANKVAQTFEKPITTGTAQVAADLRIGMTVAPDQADHPDTLLQHAEMALLAAARDDEIFAVYSADHSEQATMSMELELKLDLAIKRKEFEVYYQPKISAESFRPCGAEALIRWTDPERGPVSPELFIPMADRHGRIEPLTVFVLNTALRQASEWPRRFGPLSVSINATPRLLLDSELVELVAGALKLWDFPGNRLIIEITEGAIMTDPERSFEVLTALRKLGVQISIDDFGTGYSSLAYFKDIPADEIKIDKSFVLNMLADAGDKQIVKTIIELSQGFGLQVTGEGVEDEATAKALAALACDRLQGFHYSRPLPQHEFINWLDHYVTPEAERGARAVTGG